MQPTKKVKMSEQFLGSQLSAFASILANYTEQIPDCNEPMFKGDIIRVNEDIRREEGGNSGFSIKLVNYEALKDHVTEDDLQLIHARCTMDVIKTAFKRPKLEPEKVQWSAIDVDDDSNVFKYPKDLNNTVEGLYFDFLHNKGASKRDGPGGYTYDFENMRQIKGDAERILKREELSAPLYTQSDQIVFPTNSFPLQDDDFNKAFDCVSKEDIESDKVRVVVDLKIKSSSFEDYGMDPWDREYEKQADDPWSLNATFEDLLKQRAQEGVVLVENFMESSARFNLNTHIDGLSLREPRLFHPGSEDKVLDILHPSLFCYVHGTSHNTDEGISIWDRSAVKKPKMKFSWGKKTEEEPSKHAWLPSELEIASDGEVEFTSPLCGIHPDDTVTKNMLETLFQRAVPHLSKVLHYARNFEFMSEDWDVTETVERAYVDISRGRNLQVVPKIVDYTLQPGESYEGVWHMEGMKHEHIVATVIYVSSRDENISGGSLRFKRAFSQSEGNYFRHDMGMEIPQNAGHTRPVVSFYDKGLTPIGSLETPENALIIFPNSHVHKLAKMTNTGTKIAKRRICVFFIINPEVDVVSTKFVRNQNAEFARIPVDRQLKKWGLVIDELDEPWKLISEYSCLWSLEEAKKHQLDLMHERKYYKNTWNVREVGLCEH